MKRILAATFAGAALLSTVAAGPQSAQADVDHELAMSVGETASVAGGAPQGIAPDYHGLVGTPFAGVCDHGQFSYCESILVQLTNPYEEENAKKGRERANLNLVLTPDQPVADFDFKVFESDETGARGAELATAGATPLADDAASREFATVVVTTTEDVEVQWVLVEVAYFAAPSTYTMDLDFA